MSQNERVKRTEWVLVIIAIGNFGMGKAGGDGAGSFVRGPGKCNGFSGYAFFPSAYAYRSPGDSPLRYLNCNSNYKRGNYEIVCDFS